jgi:hypothetical protein
MYEPPPFDTPDRLLITDDNDRKDQNDGKVIGIVRASAPAPASTSTRMISSVAYADDDVVGSEDRQTREDVEPLVGFFGARKRAADEHATHALEGASEWTGRRTRPRPRHEMAAANTSEPSVSGDADEPIARLRALDRFAPLQVGMGDRDRARFHRLPLLAIL